MIKKTGLLCSVLVCLLFLPAAPVTLLSQELGEWGSSWDDGDETGEFDGLGQYDEAGMSGGSAGTDFDERAGLYGYVESRAAVSFDRDTAGLGFSTRLRLKGEWKSSDVITARMEMGYNEDEGVLNSLTRALDLGIYPAVALQAENPQDSFFGRFEVDQAWGVVNLGCFDLSLGKNADCLGQRVVLQPDKPARGSCGSERKPIRNPGHRRIRSRLVSRRRLGLGGNRGFSSAGS